MLSKTESFQPQSVQQQQISPRLISTSTAISAVSDILNIVPQQSTTGQPDEIPMKPSEGVSVQDIATRYYLTLLKQQCQHQELVNLSPQQQPPLMDNVIHNSTSQSTCLDARSPHETAEYYAAATMAAMAVMQPEVNRACVPNSASSVLSEALRLWLLDTQLLEDVSIRCIILSHIWVKYQTRNEYDHVLPTF